MMKLECLFENFDLAREVLEHWPCDRPVNSELLSRFRISSNAVYPFTARRELCFLRLAPVGEKREGNLRGELEFIQYLRRRGYPALEPLPAEDGSLFLRLDTRWGQYFASAFKAVPGKPIEDMPLTKEIVNAYGRSLGRLHNLSAEFRPGTPKWSWEDALQWAADTLVRHQGPEDMTAAVQKLQGELARLPKTPETFGLVHYDFEPDNVFFEESSHTCSAIDFDDGMYHWYALDVEQALDALLRLPAPAGLDAAGEFLRGYGEERAYTREMEEQRPLMRRFADLYAYARICRSLASRPAQEPDWLVSLRAKLTQRLADIRRVYGGEPTTDRPA